MRFSRAWLYWIVFLIGIAVAVGIGWLSDS